MNHNERIDALKALGLMWNNLAWTRGQIEVKEEAVTGWSDADFTNLVTDIKAYMLANQTEYPLHTEQTQELSIIDKAKDTLLSGVAVLQRNQQKAAVFVKASNDLKAKILANGGKLSAELDIKANEAVLKLKKAYDEIDEDTKPIRQAMVFIRDELTACTKAVKAEEDIIQGYRNQWAKEVEAERKRLAEEERKAAEKRQELINVKADIEKALLKYFHDHLAAKKLGVNTWFNGFTLADFEAKSESMKNKEPEYDVIHFRTFTHRYTGSILRGEEVSEIINSVRTDDKYNEFASMYYDQMIELRNEKIDLLPSKKAELERIAEFEREQKEEADRLAKIQEEQKTANEARQKELAELQRQAEARQQEARQKELEELQAQQQREEDERKEQEEANRKLLASQQTNVDVVAAQETTLNMFEQHTNSTPSASGPKTKTVLKATITNSVGMLPIIQLWFESVGKDMTVEDLMKKFDFMFTFASKEANKAKNPLKIENEFVEYIEDTKAVTTKTKVAKEVAEV